MDGTKLLQMQNITKAFASNIVLTGVNLSVGEGEVVAILGENGAGKSTLIKILGGIYKADSGEIRINGEVKNIHSAAVAEPTESELSIRKSFWCRPGQSPQMFLWVGNSEINLVLSMQRGWRRRRRR